jgi:hypothetical protein
MPDQLFDALESDNGAFALIPLDYNTAARVQRWGKPADRHGKRWRSSRTVASRKSATSLMTSDALLMLDVLTPRRRWRTDPGDSTRDGSGYVHLNFGESYDDMRDTRPEGEHLTTAVCRRGTRATKLFLFVQWKNLNRFLGANSSGTMPTVSYMKN